MSNPAGAPAPGRQRPSLSTMVNIGLAIAMIAVIGAVSLSSRQSAPPAIAEFAPQAVQQIKKAPDNQTATTGKVGGQKGECGLSASCGVKLKPSASPSPSPSPRLVIDPNIPTKLCVGSPPRQTEDPQSPPCVPYYKGNNGGATYKGVSATEIRVAWAHDGGEDYTDELRVMESYFNQRYEFYGRTLHLIPYQSSGSPDLSKSGPQDMVADAVHVDQEIKAFAAVNYGDRIGSESVYYDELARRKIISVASQAVFSDEAHRQAVQPYEWSYLPGPDTVSRNTADYICKSLVGRNADYAGGAQRTKRVFGVIYHRTPDGRTADLGALNQGLAACGTKAMAIQVTEPAPSPDYLTSAYQNAMSQFKAAGVTSIICLCRQAVLLYGTNAADAVSYTPEWIISSWKETDDEPTVRTMKASQTAHVFGLSFWNKRVAPEDTDCLQAAKSVDPNFTFSTHQTINPPYISCDRIYKPLLLLASGIQLAGPNLTPTSFQRGLFEAEFPNPGARIGPNFQSRVGFAAGDHIENDDAALVWWNSNATSYEATGGIGTTQQGAFCYVDHGLRYGPGDWPRRPQPLFTGQCR